MKNVCALCEFETETFQQIYFPFMINSHRIHQRPRKLPAIVVTLLQFALAVNGEEALWNAGTQEDVGDAIASDHN
jgi:hypothetical protein